MNSDLIYQELFTFSWVVYVGKLIVALIQVYYLMRIVASNTGYTIALSCQVCISCICQDGCPRLSSMSWYRSVALYGHTSSTSFNPSDLDNQLIPMIVEKVLVPKLTGMAYV